MPFYSSFIRLVDIWSEPNALKKCVDVLVAPEFTGTFLKALRKKGVDHVEVLKNNIQRFCPAKSL